MEAAQLNRTNAAKVAVTSSGEVNLPVKSSGANTNRFLIHWRGRASFIRPMMLFKDYLANSKRIEQG